MSWLANLFGLSAATPEPWDDFWYEPAEHPTESGAEVGTETALKTSAVFACVRLRANLAGMLPLHLYRRLDDDGRERATDHPLYDLLRYRPNSWQTPIEFRSMMQAHVDLRGNGFAEVKLGRSGQISELIPLHPDRVRVLIDTAGALVYEYIERNQEKRRLLPDEIFHLRGLSLDGYVGLSTIGYARETIGRQLSMERSNARFHKNDATPRVVIKHPQSLSDPAKLERLRTSWNSAYSGSANAHKAAILEEGADVVALGLKPEDAQFVESWEGGVADIARWFEVHPRKIGAKSGDSQTYANVEQAQIEFITDTGLPIWARWEQAISRDLLLPRERNEYYAEHTVEALLRADVATQAALYEKAFGRWMTTNEIRTRMNLGKVTGGDDLSASEPATDPPTQPVIEEGSAP